MTAEDAHWPYGRPLPNPSRWESGFHAGGHCNAEIRDAHGEVIAYCSLPITGYSRGFWRWKIPAGTHRGPHTPPERRA